MPLIEADLKQSENLKMAQSRILELEVSIESLRLENENLTAAQQVARDREEDLNAKVQSLERSRIEVREQWAQEIAIYKDNLATRDTEVQRLRTRIEELENRLQSDLRRVRVRERELENRLEIGKNDKIAIIKSKDETILDLKRKTDQLYSDLEKYKQKCLELSHKIDGNNEQFDRTIRALRIALANLEAAEETKSTPLNTLKKVD
jgi:chromosome segregation ATPase